MSQKNLHQLNHLAEKLGVDISTCLITFNLTNSTDGSAGGDERAGREIDSEDFAYQQVVSNNITVAAITLYIWEWAVAFPSELHLYRTRGWSSPQAVLLFLIRVGTLPSVFLSGYLTFNNFERDEGCPQHTQLTVAVVQLIVSLTFGWRAIAIWRKDRRIVALVAFIVCAQFAVSMTLLWFSDTVRLSNSTCMAVPAADGFNSFPWFYLTAMIGDFSLMAISTYKLWQFADLDSPAAVRRRESSANHSRSHVTATSSSGNHSANLNPDDSRSRSGPLPSRSRSRSRSSLHSFANNVSNFRLKCLSLTPLLRQLLKNGLFYFLGAAAFNIVNLALEMSNNLHAKAVLQLYAPLMSVLASRVILLEVKALYGSRNGGSGSRERNLVEQVIKANQGRESWEGDDDEESRRTTARIENQLIRDEKDLEVVGLSESESPNSNPVFSSNPTSSPESSSHRIIQVTPSELHQDQSDLSPLSTPLATEGRRPSALSFESSPNIKSVSKAFPHPQGSHQAPPSTPILPQVVVEASQEREEEASLSKEVEGWGLKNRLNSLKRSAKSPSSALASKSAEPPTENTLADHNHLTPELNFNSLRVPPSSEGNFALGESPKTRIGSKPSTSNRHPHSHSRHSSIGSTRSFDPSQLSEANKALALRMAGMDSSPKRETKLADLDLVMTDDELEDEQSAETSNFRSNL